MDTVGRDSETHSGHEAPKPPQGPNAASTECQPPARELSKHLARALALASHRDGELLRALQFPLEKTLAQAVHEHPAAVAQMLAPVVGRALVHSILHGLAQVLRALDGFLMRNATPRGWSWRIEALRTGRALREVIFEHSLVHRVMQVYLIHRGTGDLLCSVQDTAGVETTDEGMLSAIQHFSRDTLDTSPDARFSDTILFGEMTVWVERGPEAILAGVVYGAATDGLRRRFQNVLEQIHSDFREELAAYDGGRTAFADTRIYLEECLHTHFHDQRNGLLPITWAVVGVAAIALTIGAALSLREQMRWSRCTDSLANQPGFVIMESGRKWGTPYLRGWRDPMSPDPEFTLAKWGFSLDNTSVQLTPVLSPDPVLALRRAGNVLQPPEGVTLRMSGGNLYAEGAANQQWVDVARQRASGLVGVERFDARQVTTWGGDRRWEQWAARLEEEPGIVVIEKGWAEDRFFIRGLRDPLAASPLALLSGFALSPDDLTADWEPYSSAAPQFLKARAVHLLAPPEGVTISVEDGTLHASGRANGKWIREATLLARALPGVSRFDSSSLVDTDRALLNPLVKRIEGTHIRFLDGRTDLWPGQSEAVAGLVSDITELRRSAAAVDLDIRLTLIPHVRDAGDRSAVEPEEELAARLLQILVEPPLGKGLFSVRTGSSDPERPESPAFARFVTLNVELTGRASPQPSLP